MNTINSVGLLITNHTCRANSSPVMGLYLYSRKQLRKAYRNTHTADTLIVFCYYKETRRL